MQVSALLNSLTLSTNLYDAWKKEKSYSLLFKLVNATQQIVIELAVLFNTVNEVDATAASDYRFMPNDALGLFSLVVVWGHLLTRQDYPLSLCWLMTNDDNI